MRRSSLLPLCLLAATASADVDLTPHYYSIPMGNAELRRCYFADGDKKFAVSLDSEMEIVSQGQGALFRFPKLPGASIQFMPSPLPAKSGFDQAALPAYDKAAKAMIDATARDLASEPGGMDVLPFNDWKSYRVNFAYSIAGTKIRQSYTFMNLSPEQQCLIVVTAREKDFEGVQGRADNTFRRWHRILPGDEKGLN